MAFLPTCPGNLAWQKEGGHKFRPEIESKHRMRLAYASVRVKALCYIFLLAAVLTGCGQRDPIDQVVRQESSNPYFGNGLFVPIHLPATTSPEQLASAIFNRDSSTSGNKANILETKKVQIRYKDSPEDARPDACSYIAMLVDTASGRKVVLLQYHEGGSKGLGGWWHQVYDQSTSVQITGQK